MKRSSIDSLIKFPLLLPSETGFQLQIEPDLKNADIKNTNRNETNEDSDEDSTLKLDSLRLSNGYIKYPKYDFF